MWEVECEWIRPSVCLPPRRPPRSMLFISPPHSFMDRKRGDRGAILVNLRKLWSGRYSLRTQAKNLAFCYVNCEGVLTMYLIVWSYGLFTSTSIGTTQLDTFGSIALDEQVMNGSKLMFEEILSNVIMIIGDF